MGMFDSVYVPCPSCGAQVEFQSKAGDCTLDRYPSTSVPPAIAEDIDGDVEECDKCYSLVQVVAPELVTVSVAWRLVEE